jgi:EAL domain-containing protein (putative c-di-GMP-specific phosphodiesterase class I)/FixJ family two-component response regulator
MSPDNRSIVLCVDDDDYVLEGISLQLGRRYKVLTACCGADGLMRLTEEPRVAVIISDLRMPGLDGAQFLARARTIAPRAMRILLTGQADVNAAVAAVNQGRVSSFLRKPCPPDELLATVESAVDSHRRILARRAARRRARKLRRAYRGAWLRVVARESGKGASGVGDEVLQAQTLRLAKDLPHAIRDGQLALHFQPIVDLETRKPTSMEALVRWTHPELGDVSPTAIIQAAERHGEMCRLGDWILRRALRDGGAFLGSHCQRIAVNVSVTQLIEPGFICSVMDALTAAGLDPGSIELEVTESVFCENLEDFIDVLERLRERGVRLSIDDFGTGYSSLSYLHRLPVDAVKVDRAFIVGWETGGETIISSVVAIARGLGLEVIVEGVETETQSRRIAELGVLRAQGYLYGKPAPLAVLATRWRDCLPGPVAPSVVEKACES